MRVARRAAGAGGAATVYKAGMKGSGWMVQHPPCIHSHMRYAAGSSSLACR